MKLTIYRRRHENMSSYPIFPAQEDWTRIYNESQFDHIFSLWDRIHSQIAPKIVPDSPLSFDLPLAIEVKGGLNEVHQMIGDTGKSYILMMFYYGQGILDTRPNKVPNGPTKFNPMMDSEQLKTKDWFDYYSDTFYYKLFSAWDLIGHFLNVKYDLKIVIKKVDFKTAIEKLQDKDKVLFEKLKCVTNSPDYERANTIRNDITHNYLPNSPGIAVTREEKEGTRRISVGEKSYTSAAEIVTNIKAILTLFASTLEAMSDQS